MIQEPLKIYTDGSSYSKPRMGGIGIRFVGVDEMGDEVIEDRSYRGLRGQRIIKWSFTPALQV